MRRIEKKLFKLGDQLASLREARRLAEEELTFHRHLHDDAKRDAAVTGSPFDREDEAVTRGDVARLQRHIDNLSKLIEQIEERRVKLLRKLD